MERRVVEFYLAGNTRRKICKKLKIGDRKVRRILALADSHGYLSGERPLPAVPLAIFPLHEPNPTLGTSTTDKVLLDHKPWIEERLRLGWKRVTVWEELPIKVNRSSFYRFLDRHKLDMVGEKHRLIPEIVHKPGEALICDWGKLRTVTHPDGTKQILWAFIGVLGFSRYMMVRLVWTNDIPTTISVLESMMNELGVVPSRITSDNPKCFALKADKYEPLLNPVQERWCAHYGTVMECLPPSDPEKKGKVERLVPYVRRLYEAHGEAWFGLEESQNYINKKVVIANERKHGTTGLRPIDDLKTEVLSLKALPALAYEMEDFHVGEVRRDGYVRFRNKYYSVGSDYVGKEVAVLGTKTHVSIYHSGKLLEVHDRIWDPHISKSTKLHHLKQYEQVMTDGAVYIKRAEKIGPFVAKLVGFILACGNGFVDTRKVWGILSLDKNHAPEVIDRACKLALEMGEPSYRRVLSLINLSPQKRPTESPSPKTNNHKFVRDLDEYQQLLLKEQKERMQ